MHIVAALLLSWVFAYYCGKISARYTNRMFTNVVIGITALAGNVIGLFISMRIV